MNEGAVVFVVAASLLLMPLIYVALQFNALVALRNHCRDAWSNIDTELKRRYELIPNLVAAAKGYAQHEKEVLERVTELRDRCFESNGALQQQAADEIELVVALKQFLAVVEKYPELKADRHFLALQGQLVTTEDRIQAARRFFNGNVRDYRVKCETFPSNAVAKLFGFEREDYFHVSPAVREVPDVDF